MYDNPHDISVISKRVINKIGWKELDSRKVTEQYLNDIARFELGPPHEYQPGGDDNIRTRNSIVACVITSIRRLKPVVG